MNAISLTNVSMRFPEGKGRKLTVLEDINLEIALGEFFVMVGPSGSGKSTILRIMSGLESGYEGTVRFATDLKHSDCSFVFQQFALLPWLTVSENIGLGLVARGIPEHEQKTIVSQELSAFGLTHFAHAYPRELSGGMRQRVGIARALATRPKVIFMDEPFSELDSFTAEELRLELLEIWRERRPTIVMVTHIVPEALELADRIAVMTPRPGRIEAIVENVLPRPRPKRTEGFFKLEDQLLELIKE